jgi:transposase-like protein
VYSSQLTEWRRARDAGTLGARKSGRSATENREIEKLTKKNQRLEDELERTRLALDIVGKAHALLESLSKRADNE